MTFAVSIYVDSRGTTYRAGQTDQAGSQCAYEYRTYNHRPVVFAGDWFGSQMPYRPSLNAVAEAAEEAKKIEERTESVAA